MPDLLPDLILDAAHRSPEAQALAHGRNVLTYAELARAVDTAAWGFRALGLGAAERAAVYLDKRPETVVAMFGCSRAGGCFVPVNPLLKAEQVGHVLADSAARVLVTSRGRLEILAPVLPRLADLRHVVLVDADETSARVPGWAGAVQPWSVLATPPDGPAPARRIDADMTAILYTSGSTGRPKGVVLSHRNLVAGACSVARYLGNHAGDRILSVLPLSFDAGFSQLTTGFRVGARVTLLNYLLPRDVPRAAAREGITGITGVPPLWIPLSALEWPEEARRSLRYVANTGGAMPRAAVDALRRRLPDTRVFLMYGLTEAFRSTYLEPEAIDERPGSIGKAIPNAEILVVRPDGSECDADEPGELVHRGALVAMGYWNDPERTAERFRPAPGQPPGLPRPEIAVWSGDTVRRDADGYLYFVGRRDEMIKTSGYRVSPTEVEEVVYTCPGLAEAVAVGVPHPVLGQAIVVVAVPGGVDPLDPEAVLGVCRERLPVYMVPSRVVAHDGPLPRGPNGKIDRRRVAEGAAAGDEAPAPGDR